MNSLKYPIVFALLLTLVGCGEHESDEDQDSHGAHDAHKEVTGTHGGNVVSNEGFSLEISIFENGVPPEFRVWTTINGKHLTAYQSHLIADKQYFAKQLNGLLSHL